MNRDEFEFLIVNTPSLWKKGKIEADEEDKDSIEITEEGLSLRKYYTHILAESYNLGQLSPVDFALDSCGLLYILDSTEKKLVIFDTNAGTYQWVECISFTDPRALAIDSSNIYVADGDKIRCLARANYQTRWEARIQEAAPIDMALDSKESLCVLDGRDKKVFKVDKSAAVSEVKLTKGRRQLQLTEPVNIAIDREDHLYILEHSEKKVLKFNPKGRLESTISLTNKVNSDFDPSALAVDELGNLYIGNKSTSGTPYKIDSSGTATPLGYQGAVYSLISNNEGDLYLLGEDEIALLKLAERYIGKGIYITKQFDSTVSECQWHKVVVDTDIPANTRMSIFHYISDENTLPTEPAWSEPMINFEDALILSDKGRYIWFKIELLSDDLHSASPRIKSLKIYFPRLSYLRYLPATYQENEASREFLERFLSLFETTFSDLEEVIHSLTRYIDSEATPDTFLPWLSSWLAIAYDENWEPEKVRRLIGEAPELYKKRGTRAGIVQIIEIFTGEKPIIVENFLLKFMTDKAVEGKLAQKANLGESRLFLKDASGFQEEDVIKISNGTKEEFAVIDYKEANALKLRRKITFDYDTGAAVRKMQIGEVLYGDCPYRFCVLLKPAQVKTDSELNAVRRIIEREKPAHTVGGLRALQPWIYLDMHTYLGINTILTEPVFILGNSSVMSRDTFLSDLEESGQIDLRARLAIDTKLT